jgi:hypothetical protein
MMMVPLFVENPAYAVVAFAGIGITIVAVVAVVRRFRRYAVDRVPARFIESPKTTVRMATRAATTYATFLVGFYTVVAVLLLFTVVGHVP